MKARHSDFTIKMIFLIDQIPIGNNVIINAKDYNYIDRRKFLNAIRKVQQKYLRDCDISLENLATENVRNTGLKITRTK